MKTFTAKVLSLLVVLAIPAATPSFAQYSNDKAGLADAIKDYSTNHFWESKVVDKCMTYNLSPSCWAKLMSDRDWGLGTVMRVSRNMNQFMMNNKGAQDLEAQITATVRTTRGESTE